MKVLVPLVMDPVLTQPADRIAASAERLLLDDEFEGISGALFLQIRRFRELKTLDSELRDPRVGRRLWEFSERLSRAHAPTASLL